MQLIDVEFRSVGHSIQKLSIFESWPKLAKIHKIHLAGWVFFSRKFYNFQMGSLVDHKKKHLKKLLWSIFTPPPTNNKSSISLGTLWIYENQSFVFAFSL